MKLLLNLYSPYYHSICKFREKGYFECTIQRNNSFLLNYMQLSSENLQHNCENLTTFKIAFRWYIAYIRLLTNGKYIFTKTKRKQGKIRNLSVFCYWYHLDTARYSFCCDMILYGGYLKLCARRLINYVAATRW